MESRTDTFCVSGVCSINGELPIALNANRVDGFMRCMLAYTDAEIVRRLGGEKVFTILKAQDISVSAEAQFSYEDNHNFLWAVTKPNNLQDELLAMFINCNLKFKMEVRFGDYANIECTQIIITELQPKRNISDEMLELCPARKQVQLLIESCARHSNGF